MIDWLKQFRNYIFAFVMFNSSSYTYVWYGSTGYPGGYYRMYQGYGIHDTADVITGFQIENNESAGEFATGGQIKIYGIRIDS